MVLFQPSILVFLSLLGASSGTLAGCKTDTLPTATIDSGVIIGVATSLSEGRLPINKFLGVPFAASPVRFQPPATPKPWTRPMDVSNYGPACVQQLAAQDGIPPAQVAAWSNTPPPPAGESEDCLNVNVYAPVSPGKKPVMVWIYGGGFALGFNSDPRWDGSFMAANQDVVVVSINYRTNVFGFPWSPQLPTEHQNLGFLDQHFALDWVQRNIHAFGGDPKRVTIFGESAGAASVDALVTSYHKNPPFIAAIMESGQLTFYPNNPNPTASWNNMVAKLNCSSASDVLSCVRKIPATQIKSVIEEPGNFAFGPVRDNITFISHAGIAREHGKIAQVPILIGNNFQEGRLFVGAYNSTQQYLQTVLPHVNQSFYDKVLAAYPIGSPGISNQFQQAAAIDTDYRFMCTASQIANYSSIAGFPTWRYLFNASFPNTQLFPGAGVYHSSEIAEIYGTYPRGDVTTKQEKLSQYMQKAWANFAKNPTHGPGWTAVSNVAVLGNSDEEMKQDVSGTRLDKVCELYKPIYSVLA
ncbi:alpha/beta-hydrolase [Trichoderma sp. SZMC 28015]